MEQVRNTRLDNVCESIGEERATMNKARTEEQSLINSAMRLMSAGKIHIYRHAKIELTLVPGADKLRVRVTPEEGNAESRQPQDVNGDDSTMSEIDASVAQLDNEVDEARDEAQG